MSLVSEDLKSLNTTSTTVMLDPVLAVRMGSVFQTVLFYHLSLHCSQLLSYI